MSLILLGLGLVCVIEGLVLALAPSLYDDLARMLQDFPPERRRMVGLAVVGFGVLLLWMVQGTVVALTSL